MWFGKEFYNLIASGKNELIADSDIYNRFVWGFVDESYKGFKMEVIRQLRLVPSKQVFKFIFSGTKQDPWFENSLR